MSDEVTATVYDSATDMSFGRLVTLADNRRLRDLIKAAEWGTENYCAWCNAKQEYEHGHYPTCPAFTPSGDVK